MSEPDGPSGRFPDFYLVGHQKCGTSALWLMLRQHPQIFVPRVKEPRYFAGDLRSALAPVGAANPLHSEAGYLSLYADARPDQLAGDVSPQYLRSQTAAAAIAAARPDAKIVAIFREPADFIRSLHEQMFSSKVEDQQDLRRALELQPARREGRELPRACHHPQSLQYTDHVRYSEQLARYREHFPLENIHLIVYDDLLADNEGAVRGLLAFLGVDEKVEFSVRRTNPVKAARSPRMHRIVGELRRARRRPESVSPAARMASAVLPERVFEGAMRSAWRRLAYAPSAPADAALAAELRERFRGEVEGFGRLIDRDLLTLWGYRQPA